MSTKPIPVLRAAALCLFAALFSSAIALAVRQNRQLPEIPAASAPAPEPAPLSLAQFHTAVESGKTLILDTRDDVFYVRGHVPHALSLPNRRFDARYAQLRTQLEADRARPIVVYCTNVYCGDSAEVQTRLKALGYTNVTRFADGWDAWKAAGYADEKSDTATVVLPPWKNPS